MLKLQDLLFKTQYLRPQDQKILKEAYLLAEKAHKGVFRKSGEPFIQHPLNVALKLANLNLDRPTLVAALLHDLPEDTKVELKEIEDKFGKEVAFLVSGVSKLGYIRLKSGRFLKKKERQIEILKRMFLAMASDLRVILLKLADRWHNLETLKYLPLEKQEKIAQETLEIYAPLAYRLGMGEMKGILEDLAFPYAYPKEYQWLSKLAIPKYKIREKYLKKVKKVLEEEIKKAKIKAEIHGRAKHFFSLYKKLEKYDYDLSKIYDLVALRILVKRVSDCYAVLGIIHKMWKPLLGRIKDYIAVPKPNGYQSLHTTVFCLEGKIVEFQIRTYKMHEWAEYGIAAHFLYKEKKTLPSSEFPWLEELVALQKKISKQEFLKGLKLDIFKDRIFVFTPKGDVVDLPEGASPIDFAYEIHTEVGHQCVGALVNGQIVPLNYQLKNGDIVKVLLKKGGFPKRDWLKFVRTQKAKERISQYLSAKEREA